jgi:hypothetical protein
MVPPCRPAAGLAAWVAVVRGDRTAEAQEKLETKGREDSSEPARRRPRAGILQNERRRRNWLQPRETEDPVISLLPKIPSDRND